MSPRSTFVHLATRAGILFGALFLVSVLLAAIPGHRAPAVATQDTQESSGSQSKESQPMEHSKMSGMDMDDAKANEAHAVHDMTPGHMSAHNLHMHMTAMRPQTPEDAARANEIVSQLRSGIEKYKDYHVALNHGYKIFLPNLPQPEYHFTNYWKGFLEAFAFDPARPTSLLYKKTSAGYELVGAMHTNLCMPQKGQFSNADWSKFGLKGAIATQQACDAAGGRFQPVIFGWMVHVYPYEHSLDKVFAMHHRESEGG